MGSNNSPVHGGKYQVGIWIGYASQKRVKSLMKMGITPVLYGDAVLDQKLGFTVLSGDQLVAYMATKFGASKIVIGVDTDGL